MRKGGSKTLNAAPIASQWQRVSPEVRHQGGVWSGLSAGAGRQEGEQRGALLPIVRENSKTLKYIDFTKSRQSYLHVRRASVGEDIFPVSYTGLHYTSFWISDPKATLRRS